MAQWLRTLPALSVDLGLNSSTHGSLQLSVTLILGDLTSPSGFLFNRHPYSIETYMQVEYPYTKH